VADARNRRGAEVDLRLPPPRSVRAMQAGPGDFTAMAVLWGAFGLYALRQGFADDRSPLVLVGATAFAVMAIGVAWPILAMRNIKVTARAPSDATVGSRVAIELDVRARARDVRVRLLDPPTAWAHADQFASGVILQRPTHRGVYRRVRVELKTSAPLGVFTRRRVIVATLDAPLYVAPRVIAADRDDVPASAVPHGSVPTHSPYVAVDAVRAVRPFVSGDPARHIHWPSTARRGELVVRDFDPPSVAALAIAVDLRGPDHNAVERAASRARGLAEAVLAQGAACCLLTYDGAPRSTFVTSRREIGRVLAAAIAGAPPEPPNGWAVEVVQP
jgi:uncharacterized protein (DUF58 family)